MSEVHKLEIYDDVQGYIDALAGAGIAVCYARRDTQLTSESWVDKTPMPARLIYLMACPKADHPKKIAVPRKFRV
jgi:hypothetical protein